MPNPKDDIVKLTMAVYRVTNLFPEKEPLRYSIRESATRLLELGISGRAVSGDFSSELEALKVYFELAKSQEWLSPSNFSVLEREYHKINEGTGLKNVEKSGGFKAQAAVNLFSVKKDKNNNGYSPKERKVKMAEIIRQEEKTSLKDITQRFPEVHRRTLIRDLEDLLKQNTIKKEGNGRNAVYVPNGHHVTVTQMETEELSRA